MPRHYYYRVLPRRIDVDMMLLYMIAAATRDATLP